MITLEMRGGKLMDAVKFIEERNRMCGTMSEVWAWMQHKL